MDTKIPNKISITLKITADFLRSCIHFFYKHLLEPKKHSEDKRRQELILNCILIGSILLIFCLDITLLCNAIQRGDDHHGVAFWKFSMILVFFIMLYVLSRRGFLRISSYSLIFAYVITVMYASYRWGVSLPSVLLIYALIIITSSILIGSKFGLSLAMIIFISMILIGKIEIKSGIIPEWKQEMVGMDDIIVYSSILLIISMISWLSSREIEKSLSRARKSEAELLVERDSLEVKVEQRTRELHQVQLEKMSQLSRFAEFGRLSTGLFHDLVSPLSTVAVNLSTIESNISPEIDSIKDNLSRAVRASKRMNTFISAVRKQVRIDQFKELFSINTVIEESVSLFQYRAMKSKLRIEFSAQEEISIYGNPIKLHQIVANLISNALDASEQKATQSESLAIQVRLWKHESAFSIAVVDNGCGINPDIIPKIFDQFFTTKSKQVSMGIGLTTTKEIVENEFNGTISVISNLTDGTTFTITIPHTQDEPQTSKNTSLHTDRAES